MNKNKPFFSGLVRVIVILFLLANFFLLKTGQAAKNNASTKAKNYQENEVVVKIEDESKLAEISQKYSLFLSPLSAFAEDKNFYVAKSLNQKPVSKLLKDLGKNPDISSVQPNYKYSQLARTVKDSYFSRQWSLQDIADVAGGVSAPSAWDLEEKKQRNVIVAVIDSGANYSHKDLKKNLTKGGTKGRNFDNTKKKPTDSDGHGTLVSGLIAAKTNDKRGIAGGSYFNHLRIMPLKFDFTTAKAITAVNYAKAKNVPVVNASWGGYGNNGLDLALKDAIAAYPGIFVTASGNSAFDHDGGNPSGKMYPCDFDLANVICVAASDRNGNLADYSDYGASSVDVAAPGGTDGDEIISLDKRKSNYASAEGSSLSAAFVSAEAGLLFSKYPNLSSAQVIEIIKNSVDLEPSLAGKITTGGKINFQKALQLAANY